MAAEAQLAFVALETPLQRAEKLLAGNSEMQLSWPERLVLQQLKFARGLKNAILRRKLQDRCNLSERQVKDTIRSLIVVHQMQIGAGRGKDCGYFLIETPEDLQAATAPLIGEVRELVRRLRVLCGPQRLAELYGQISLEEQK